MAELEHLLGVKLLTESEETDIDTLGGLVFSMLGRVPGVVRVGGTTTCDSVSKLTTVTGWRTRRSRSAARWWKSPEP